ncbi:S-adenosyl-methyltransferase [Nitzschia inconspicua]|uniref:S-adenosyl-methyltransferase n=1 Tax=Nitzschia inconspicua TaxID=303405 RepID=A0A9K3LKW5_9STRA|nr:S-adenosyl-methyltransferase [Nitzschia inconspicua]
MRSTRRHRHQSTITPTFLSLQYLLLTTSRNPIPAANGFSFPSHHLPIHHHNHQTQHRHGTKGRLYLSTTSNIPSNHHDNHHHRDQENNDDAVTNDDDTFATTYHAPVMVKECIDALLDCQRGRMRRQDQHQDQQQPLVFVDGTLGGGGHSAALLARLGPHDIVLGCDVDPNALDTATTRLSRFMNHDGTEMPLFIPVECNFGDLVTVLSTTVTHPHTQEPILKGSTNDGGGQVDGILLDFGVSSHQIDEPDRGFSFMKDGPLDMRMSGNHRHKQQQQQQGLSAADICNEFDETELQRIFSKYGDEPRAKTLAKAIVKHRPLSTTGQLVEAIASVTPAYAKNKRNGQTATCARIFQSLRIVVNNEDGVLERVLSEACPTVLRPGGRLVCLSYHSMEDRATKRIMRDGTLQTKRRPSSWEDQTDMYGNYVGPPKPFRPVGKAIKATAEEVDRNPRARSAVLRIAERL